MGEDAMVRLIISSKTKSTASTNFQKSSGWGSVQIRCQSALTQTAANLSYRIWVGDGEVWQKPRGPFCHNFAENAFCDLPPSSDLWDFNSAVNRATKTFTVCLEECPSIAPSAECRTPEESKRKPESFKAAGPARTFPQGTSVNSNVSGIALDPKCATLTRI